MQLHSRSFRFRAAALGAAAAAVSAAFLPAASPAAAAVDAAPVAPAVTKIDGAAANAAGLKPTVDAYRTLLGDPDNLSKPGSQPAGRREINWDGVPDARSAPNLLPNDFFNTTVTRGAEFVSDKWNKFQVSANAVNPTHTKPLFGNINPQYQHIFATFSPQRLFTPIDTNVMRVQFFQPGTEKRATVEGFGAVFTDVDRADSTKIELIDRHGRVFWSQHVRKGTVANKSLSFLGVKSTEDIYEVRITTGNAPLSAQNNDGWGGKDIVAMDDFLYAEPKPLH
jgi:hypothetical protein